MEKREPTKEEALSRQRIIELIVTECDGSQQIFADKTQINKASISQYVNGRNYPSNIKCGMIAKAFNINPAWVMGFDDEKFIQGKSQNATDYGTIAAEVYKDKTIRSLVQMFMELEDSEKESVYKVVFSLWKAHN